MSKLETNIIDTVAGTTNLTLGSTNTSTITIPNGKLTGQNYPAFFLKATTAQSFTNNVYTKVAFDTAVIDTDSSFDNANDRWTVPTGKGGKYLITFQMSWGSSSAFNMNAHYKINGVDNTGTSVWGVNGYYSGFSNASIVSLSAGDYIELYGRQISGSAVNGYNLDQGVLTFLGGYRIGA